MGEVAELVRWVLERPALATETLTYRELFRSQLALDPMLAGSQILRQVAVAERIAGAQTLELSRDGWLDLLLSQRIEPRLGGNA
jgi:lysyl-tRNA synthetase class 2